MWEEFMNANFATLGMRTSVRASSDAPFQGGKVKQNELGNSEDGSRAGNTPHKY
jgi:hypothetical protein